MINEFTLKVKDVFSRDSFRTAKVLAGAGGLERVIRWVHVLEVENFGSLIHGGELILTTGVGLQTDSSAQLKFVKELIESNAAGICIEKGAYFQEVPYEIIEVADRNDFPIILFEETVKFVDITQELHSLIINRHHDLLGYLDSSSRTFIQLSMAPNGILKILQELYDYFHRAVFFVPIQGKSYYFPSNQKQLHDLAVDFFQSTEEESIPERMASIHNENFVYMPVEGLGQVWGYLSLHTRDEAPEEFHYLILDRAALAIAQILLRNRTIEERKQHSEDQFVRAVLQGRHFEKEEMKSHFPFARQGMTYRVFVIENQVTERMVNEEEWEDIKLQRSMAIRALFKRFGFFPAVSATKEEIAVIAAYPKTAESSKNMLGRLTRQLLQAKDSGTLSGPHAVCGAGRGYGHISQLSKSYAEAKEVISLKRLNVQETMIAYEDIGIYRLLLPMKKNGDLAGYVEDHLGPILKYDSQHESDLYHTLQVYLACGGAKKETAERLFIVRQTLYHRLEKIENLLGPDYMEAHRRITIEAAIKGYELLKGNE
ncbi:PucR family transcriptional regulator [Siminovitchia sediminis]|uniref:PucR family transcriptional regulator n=1 Tax=Siminovitchia sediminis TaxID=1274353 RepID=A0ABW4KMM2_9BACI